MHRTGSILPLLFAAGVFACSSTPASPALSDAGTDAAVASTCAPPTGAPVEHSTTVDKDETWAAGVHVIKANVAVTKNATLTLAPCAVVQVAKGVSLTVGGTSDGDGGVLLAKGAASEAIVVEGQAGEVWGNIWVYPKGRADLAFVTLRGGGGPNARNGATLHLLGDAEKPVQPLASVDHVTIETAGKYGVVLESRAGFAADSRDLSIRGSTGAAMLAPAIAAGSIPTGAYKGNALDGIRLTGSYAFDLVSEDVTLRDRGVPYIVGGDNAAPELVIEGATAPVTLTIEAGVALKFPKGGGNAVVSVSRGTSDTPATGILKVLGTAEKPVTFTSAEATPKAGDWVGIVFGDLPNAANRIDHARIEFAGGDTGIRGFSCGTPGSDDVISNEAAIIILAKPTSAFVTNSVIANSAKNGIERGWTGDAIDFLASNTFENIAFCKQTANRPAAGQCPDPPICDK